MPNCIHVIDPDHRRRTCIALELKASDLRFVIYRNFANFSQRSLCAGYIFAADDAEVGTLSVGAEALQECGAALPVVLYSAQPATEKVVTAMLSGAAGYLEWPFNSHDVDVTFQRLVAEGVYRRREEQHRLAAQARIDLLTPREKQVLACLAEGLTNKGIGRSLQISARTVEIHRGNMMRRLNAQSAAAAVRIALHAGLDDDIQFAA